MRPELDEALCAKYPEIFRDRHKPMTETAMCWGFACGDGWYPLIDTLCWIIMSEVRGLQDQIAICRSLLANRDTLTVSENAYFTPERLAQLEGRLDEALLAIPVAAQVKEKFGGLRFYVDGGTPKHHAYISFAEVMSHRICEDCGATKDVSQTTGGWVRTLCRACAISDHNPMEEGAHDHG